MARLLKAIDGVGLPFIIIHDFNIFPSKECELVRIISVWGKTSQLDDGVDRTTSPQKDAFRAPSLYM